MPLGTIEWKGSFALLGLPAKLKMDRTVSSFSCLRLCPSPTSSKSIYDQSVQTSRRRMLRPIGNMRFSQAPCRNAVPRETRPNCLRRIHSEMWRSIYPVTSGNMGAEALLTLEIMYTNMPINLYRHYNVLIIFTEYFLSNHMFFFFRICSSHLFILWRKYFSYFLNRLLYQQNAQVTVIITHERWHSLH